MSGKGNIKCLLFLKSPENGRYDFGYSINSYARLIFFLKYEVKGVAILNRQVIPQYSKL